MFISFSLLPPIFKSLFRHHLKLLEGPGGRTCCIPMAPHGPAALSVGEPPPPLLALATEHCVLRCGHTASNDYTIIWRMPCPQCARSAKFCMSASTYFPYPVSLTLLPTIPIVCLYAFSTGISDIRESDCSVVLLHPHVLLDVSSLHLLWVVFDTFARSAPAVCPQRKVCPLTTHNCLMMGAVGVPATATRGSRTTAREVSVALRRGKGLFLPLCCWQS